MIENFGSPPSVQFVVEKLEGVWPTDLQGQAQALSAAYFQVRKRIEQSYANEKHDVLYRSTAVRGKWLRDFKYSQIKKNCFAKCRAKIRSTAATQEARV